MRTLTVAFAALTALITGCSRMPDPEVQVRDLVRQGIAGAARDLVCMVERPNAKVASYDPADQCIHYDPLALQKLALDYGAALPIAIIAHEVAHSVGASEERADETAGCAVVLQGYDLEPVLNWADEDRHAAFLRGAIHCSPVDTLTTL